VRDDLFHHLAHDGNRNGEADARLPPLREKIAVLTPTRLPAPSTSAPPGIARIDGGIGLDVILERVDAQVAAAEGRDDAHGDRLADAEGVAIARTTSPTCRLSCFAKVMAGSCACLTLSTATSVSGSVPTNVGRQGLAVGSRDLDFVGCLDDR